MTVLDTNILLEILELRQYYEATLATLKLHQDTQSMLGISTLTVSNTFYLAERHKVSPQRVELLIQNYQIFSIIPEDITWALSYYQGKDFEDALQIASALREGCTAFLTIEASLAAKYSHLLNVELIR